MDDDVQHERELRQEWQRAHDAVHVKEKEAIDTARTDVNRRLHEMNEWRKQNTEERILFVTRELHDKLEQGVDARLKLLETSRANQEGRLWMMGAAISAVVVVVNLFMHYYGVMK